MVSLPTLILLFAIAMLILEVFIPSGGVLGALSAVSLVAAIGAAYFHGGMRLGTIYLVGVAVCVPPLLYAMIKIWPNTYFGRLIMIQPPTEDETVPQTQQDRRAYVGHVGVATTSLLPAGAIRIGGKTIDAVSDGMTIEKGTPIEIVAVRGTHLIVRPTSRTPVEPIAAPIEPLGNATPQSIAESTASLAAEVGNTEAGDRAETDAVTSSAPEIQPDVSAEVHADAESAEPVETPAKQPNDATDVDQRRFEEGLDQIINDPFDEPRS